MSLNKLFKIGVILLFITSISTSCVSRKKIAYFQKNNFENAILNSKDILLNLKPQDRLTISVSAQEQAAAIPFNLPVVGMSNTNVSNSINMGTNLQTYIVNSEGNIDFPVLGSVHVEGLSVEKLKAMLTESIAEYVKKPIVTIELVNFRVSILGEVVRPGTYRIEDQSITLPKALGLAGDMTIFGKRENVLVIREESDGQVTRNYLDITSPLIIKSPYYYLRQNDIVYIEPNGAQRQGANLRNASVYVSIASILVTLAVLFTR